MNFNAAVLDTSVVLKWFRKAEIDRDKALHLRSEYLNGKLRIIIPGLLFYEVANVLRYKPDMTQRKVSSALISIENMGFDVVSPNASTLSEAVKLAYTYNITVYDATFVSLAVEHNCHFVTADEKLYNKITALPDVHLLHDIS